MPSPVTDKLCSPSQGAVVGALLQTQAVVPSITLQELVVALETRLVGYWDSVTEEGDGGY